MNLSVPSKKKWSLHGALKEAIRSYSGVSLGKRKAVEPSSPEVHDYVLKYGRFHHPQPLPPKFKMGQPGSCFGNAAMLTVHHSRLRYVEGFAFGRSPYLFLIRHAWGIDDEDRVVDTTWDFGLAYFGVVFDEVLATRWVGRNPNAMGFAASVWSETREKTTTPPATGPEKPLPLARAARAGWRLDVAPVGALPNGPGRYVVFGRDKASFKPVKAAISGAGMVVSGEEWRWEQWAIGVSCEPDPKALRDLDRIVWREWWAANEATRAGIHPDKKLLRAMAHKAIAESWPPRPRARKTGAKRDSTGKEV